jgi:succinyl-CoA synthetase beta subunit
MGGDELDGIGALFEKAKAEGRTALLEHEAKRVLVEWGVEVPPSRLARSEEEAVAAAEEIGFPLVLKVMSPRLLHKTDVGAVAIGLQTVDQVRATYSGFMERFADAEVEGVLVEKRVKVGVELIIGTRVDQTFGPVILVGPGGIFVEAMVDVVFRMCPTTWELALGAIEEIRYQKLLDGFRGIPKVDRGELADLMVKLSELAWEHREHLGEMDINPVIANEDGLYPVDARMILR